MSGGNIMIMMKTGQSITIRLLVLLLMNGTVKQFKYR